MESTPLPNTIAIVAIVVVVVIEAVGVQNVQNVLNSQISQKIRMADGMRRREMSNSFEANPIFCFSGFSLVFQLKAVH